MNLSHSQLPTYILWGPILQDAVIAFIERAGWEPGPGLGMWHHPEMTSHGEVGYLRALEITGNHLFTDSPPAEPAVS